MRIKHVYNGGTAEVGAFLASKLIAGGSWVNDETPAPMKPKRRRGRPPKVVK